MQVWKKETSRRHVCMWASVSKLFFLEDVTPAAVGEDLGATLARQVLHDHPQRRLRTPLDRLATLIGQRYGIMGGRYTNCSACAAGTQVIGEALRQLRDGRAPMALAGGADSMLNPLGLGGFSLLKALSTRNDQPATACRPFDATRDGAVLGEGRGVCRIGDAGPRPESRGHGFMRKLLGYGSSMDAFSVTDPAPDGRGAVRSMTLAVRDAQLKPEQIDCVNAHATGTPKNDAIETAAIKQVLGPRARDIPVHAVKSMTGHLIGASGAVEAVAAALTLNRGVVPPTINLRNPDPACDLDYVEDGARAFQGRTVLSNSFGFGGQNASLVLSRWE